ncbi:TonB-dependent receptor plug domain-containing protein [Massilia niastensis]|uniref:TonB-dependent receptor plug domain-containing protein n=1 Tax=Massilia niastensis TaxID=544911 RepID=UPI000370B1F9|nr:TonB-dependent receptor [Massilia niastensis]
MSRSIRAICLGGMTLGMHVATAQEAGQPLQRVEVTGSRIRQVDLETAQPIQVMSQEQIQKSGLVTVGDILSNLSSAGGEPAFSKGGALNSNRESGGQYINLRNLESKRLLVLVDGKRWTQTVDGFTDVSTVPAAMIERIEVLKDGASSIYGSDAIAGVVNIILKKSLTGGQISLYTGANEKADGRNKDFSLTYGAGDDKASLMFGLSHTTQGAVWPGTRNITSTTGGPNHPTAGLGVGPWGQIRPVAANGGPGTGFNKVLNHTGSYDGKGVGADPRNPANYHATGTGADDRYNTSQDTTFIMPNKLDTIFTKGRIQLPKDITLSTTAMYSQRKSTQQLAGYPLRSDSQPGFPVYVDKDHYWNPYGNQVAGAGNGQDLFFNRRTIEVPRVTENESRTLHLDAALEGNFELRGLPWNWSAAYNYNEVSGTSNSTGNLNLFNLKKALGPSFRNASGQIQCGTPGKPIALAECVPFNILGGPSASTPEALAYVMSNGQASFGSKVSSANLDLSGEVLQLPAGALAVAGGVEHREVEGYDRPDQFAQSGFSTDLAGNPTFGKYIVREAYLEANIPVLKNVRFAEHLSFNLATRYSDYSNFGNTTNSKISFMYKPVKDILTRGTYAEGFRAPTVGDTFGGGTQSYDTYLDACDTRFGEAGRNPGVLARCLAAGVPNNFRQIDQTGAPIKSVGGAQGGSPFQAGAGNSSLQPETATTATLGLVYSPSWLPGFSAAVDWYNIKVDNRISEISANYVVEQCYIQGVGSFCNAIKRDPATGAIINLSRGNANLGQLKTEGFDVALGYRLPRTQYGQFTVRSETSYVDSYMVKNSADAQWYNRAGDYFYNRVKSNMSLDWSLGNWSATWTARYQSGVNDECWDVQAGIECNRLNDKGEWGTGVNKLGSLTYHDVNVGYKTPWNGRIALGINNLFDKGPRVTYRGGADAAPVDADLPLDRFVYVRYTQSF